MKILLSAFDCNPYWGSDPYVGWSWVYHLAKKNKVYVITRSEHKSYIDKYLANHPEESFLKSVDFEYIDSSKFFNQYILKFNRYIGIVGAYFLWQRPAYKKAQKLVKECNIDICHLVSIADFRLIGHMSKLKVPFIFGPVGGAQETPSCLKSYISGHEKNELFRCLMNRMLSSSIHYRNSLRRASLIFASNDETETVIKRKMATKYHGKIRIMTELGVDYSYLKERENLQHNVSETVHIMVSGRLMYRKGLMLLLDALATIHTSVNYVVDIWGGGEQEQELKQHVTELGLNDIVIFHGNIPFVEMQEKYKNSDIYILPSLRETTGTAVFEAMSNKLPVIALKQNGVKYVVGDDAGILIDIVSKEQVCRDMGAAIQKLVENAELRIQYGEAAYKKMKDCYTWDAKIENMSQIYEGLIGKKS